MRSEQPQQSVTGVEATLPPITPVTRQFHMRSSGYHQPQPAATSGASSATTSSGEFPAPASPGKKGPKPVRPQNMLRFGSFQPPGQDAGASGTPEVPPPLLPPQPPSPGRAGPLSESAVAAAGAIVDAEDAAAAERRALKQKEQLAVEQSGQVDAEEGEPLIANMQGDTKPLHTTKSQDRALDQLEVQPDSLRPAHRLRGLRAFLHKYAGDIALALSLVMDVSLLAPGMAAIAAAGNPLEPLSQALVGTGNDGLVELLNASGPGIGRVLARAGASLVGDMLCFAAPAPVLAGVALAFVHWACTKPKSPRLTDQAKMNFTALMIASMTSVLGFGIGIDRGLRWSGDHDAVRDLLRQPASELPNACTIEELGSSSAACVPAVSAPLIARQVVPQLQDRYLDLSMANPSVLLLLINAGIIFLMLLLRVCGRAYSSFGARGEKQALLTDASRYYSRLASPPPGGGVPVMGLQAGRELEMAADGASGRLVPVRKDVGCSGAQVDELVDPSVRVPGADGSSSGVQPINATGSVEEPVEKKSEKCGSCIML